MNERGDDASGKLQVAASLFATIAELRIALEGPSPETNEGMHEMLAQVTIRSAMLDQVDMLMTAIELGWFDKLADYEMDREKRRRGAATTNAKNEDETASLGRGDGQLDGCDQRLPLCGAHSGADARTDQ